MKVGIVGGGVFGSVIGAALHKQGCKVTIFDRRKPDAGSLASGFLMKPSWFGNMEKSDSERSLKLLDELYGLQELKFRVGPVKTTVFRVDKKAVLENWHLEYLEQKIDSVKDGWIDDQEFHLVVVAAGVWCRRFFDLPDLKGKVGISFEWDGELRKNIISAWAPYKQVVAFNIPGEGKVWGGDGTAILGENWTSERGEQCLSLVSKTIGFPKHEARAHVGIRPYYKTKDPCLVEKRGHKLWLATGGSKNGTIGAGWAANKILDSL